MTAVKIIGLDVNSPLHGYPPSLFSLVLLLRTTTDNESVTIPCFDNGVFDAIITWGDYTGEFPVTSYNDSNLTHEYLVPGDYEVSIVGQFPNSYYNYGANRLQIIKVLDGGVFDYGNSMFYGCTNLDFISPNLDVSTISDFFRAWSFCGSLTEFPSLNVSNGRSFYSSWGGCSNLEYFPPNMFDNLTGQMLANCFNQTWFGCQLNSQSVENILVSIDSALITPFSTELFAAQNRIIISTKLGEPLTIDTVNAINSLKTKLWTTRINGILQ